MDNREDIIGRIKELFKAEVEKSLLPNVFSVAVSYDTAIKILEETGMTTQNNYKTEPLGFTSWKKLTDNELIFVIITEHEKQFNKGWISVNYSYQAIATKQ